MNRSEKPAYEVVASTLRDEILGGILAFGEQLPTEPELCARFGVGRSTLREALRLLSSQHLIVTTRGVRGGSFVVQPEPEHVAMSLRITLELLTSPLSTLGSFDELMELVTMLELPAVRSAAEHRRPQVISMLDESLYDKHDVAPDDYSVKNRDFHRSLLRVNGNSIVAAVGGTVWDVSGVQFDRALAPSSFLRRVDAEHREVVKWIKLGEADKAVAVHARHLKYVRGAYRRMDRR